MYKFQNVCIMSYLILINEYVIDIYRKNTSILTRSVSEMNLNVPSNKRFENSRKHINFHSNKMKNNGTVSQ